MLNSVSKVLETDIEQVKNEKKSLTCRCMLRQRTREDAGEGQTWQRARANAGLSEGSAPG
jgi:hypothetical protein